MRQKILYFLFCSYSFLFTLQVKGDEVDVTVRTDIVNAYIWRGQYMTGVSIQPKVNFYFGKFQIETWGNTDIARGDYKEIDVVLYYSFDRFKAGLGDIWISNEDTFNLFDFNHAHYIEATLEYQFRPAPLRLLWSTFVAGADKYTDSEGKRKNAYSSYLEVAYSFEIKKVSLEAVVGCSPWRSMVQHTGGYPHATDGFAVVDISLKAEKTILITERILLNTFGQIIVNPAREDAFFVFGIRI